MDKDIIRAFININESKVITTNMKFDDLASAVDANIVNETYRFTQNAQILANKAMGFATRNAATGVKIVAIAAVVYVGYRGGKYAYGKIKSHRRSKAKA